MKTLTLLAAILVPAVAASAASMTAKIYVMKAGASDMFEMESSKLVQNSTDPKVASFATMMIADHGKSTDDVVAAAKADGMTPAPPAMTPKQKAMIQSLTSATGTKRDMLYKKDQVAAHQETLMFQKAYAMSGDKPNLKMAAGKIVPVVETHLATIKAMAPTARM